jgi:hypothetical protein
VWFGFGLDLGVCTSGGLVRALLTWHGSVHLHLHDVNAYLSIGLLVMKKNAILHSQSVAIQWGAWLGLYSLDNKLKFMEQVEVQYFNFFYIYRFHLKLYTIVYYNFYYCFSYTKIFPFFVFYQEIYSYNIYYVKY